MKKAFTIAIVFLTTGQTIAQDSKAEYKKMETTEHYTFQLSDKVSR